MGYKNICLNCRRVENLGTDINNHRTGKCPECLSDMNFVNHKFKPPKKGDNKAWELVEFLITNGFIFQHIYQDSKSQFDKTEKANYVSYPKNMIEAREFVKTYKNQSIKN